MDKISDARAIIKLINPEVLEKNPECINQIFETVLEKGELPFLKNAENAEELKEIILEAKENGANDNSIEYGIKEIIIDNLNNNNSKSIEMLYMQLEYLEYSDRKGAISTFFIYAKDELKEKNIEEILKQLLIEKRFFEKEDIDDVINNSIK